MIKTFKAVLCLVTLAAVTGAPALAGDMEYTGPNGSSIDLTCNGDDRPAGSCEAADSSISVDTVSPENCDPVDGDLDDDKTGLDDPGELMELEEYTDCLSGVALPTDYIVFPLAPPTHPYNGVRVLNPDTSEVGKLCFYESSPDIQMIGIRMQGPGLNAKIRLFDAHAVPQGGTVTVILNGIEVSVNTSLLGSGAAVNDALLKALTAEPMIHIVHEDAHHAVIQHALGLFELSNHVQYGSTDMGLQHTGLGMGPNDDHDEPNCAY